MRGRSASGEGPLVVGLVVFDLDGTLVDSLGDLADSMNAVLAGRGLPVHPEESYRRFVGDGIETLVRRALPEARRDDVPVTETVAAMRAEYASRQLRRTRPYPQVPELLAELRARGLRTAVLSNKPDDATQEVVAALLDHRFDAVRGARPGVPLKPDPTAALDLCADLGVSPSETTYLGDTDTDMATGRRAGMLTVGVAWGFRDAGELLAHGARHIIRQPLDLIALLDGATPGDR
jgi:phosphoglycolate phosphatase